MRARGQRRRAMLGRQRAPPARRARRRHEADEPRRRRRWPPARTGRVRGKPPHVRAHPRRCGLLLGHERGRAARQRQRRAVLGDADARDDAAGLLALSAEERASDSVLCARRAAHASSERPPPRALPWLGRHSRSCSSRAEASAQRARRPRRPHRASKNRRRALSKGPSTRSSQRRSPSPRLTAVRSARYRSRTRRCSSRSATGEASTSVALSGDGTRAIVDAERASVRGLATGIARVLARSGNRWSEEATLTPGDGVAGDRFGVSVALSADASRAFVGAARGPSASGVEVFVHAERTWASEAVLRAGALLHGAAVAASSDGSRVVVGARLADGARVRRVARALSRPRAPSSAPTTRTAAGATTRAPSARCECARSDDGESRAPGVPRFRALTPRATLRP